MLNDKGFHKLAAIAYNEAGLVLTEAKATMIQSRLRHRLRAVSVPDIEGYCNFLNGPSGGQEIGYMISALTTNTSSFFREPHHFRDMTERLLPELLERASNDEPLRIWSAGCSNGQEPYSIAIALLEYNKSFSEKNCKILATDIDDCVLRFASKGRYSKAQVSGMNSEKIERYTKKLTGDDEVYQISPELMKMIHFRKLNLLSDWPMRRKFDIIFCRNVVIYFDSQTQDTLWTKFQSSLQENGTIYVGHSERINAPQFELVGSTAYSIKPTLVEFPV